MKITPVFVSAEDDRFNRNQQLQWIRSGSCHRRQSRMGCGWKEAQGKDFIAPCFAQWSGTNSGQG
jgi:hypothetical protein